MKPGTKLLSHEGHIWEVARHDSHSPGRVVLRTHEFNHFFCPITQIKYHARKLRWYHRLWRWIGW
jgi:hypothetical protein